MARSNHTNLIKMIVSECYDLRNWHKQLTQETNTKKLTQETNPTHEPRNESKKLTQETDPRNWPKKQPKKATQETNPRN